MIETITPAGCGSRNRYRVALLLFTVGAVGAAALVGALLGLLGGALGLERAVLVVAALAALAAAREAGFLRVPVPQFRRQVPERWNHELPLPVWATGYGVGLGVGFLTFQPFATFWVAVLAALAVGRPATAGACFALFGVGRAVMVVLPPRPDRDVTRVVESLAARRPLLRRANAAALAACAVLLATAPLAAARAMPLGKGNELDPAHSNRVIAYTKRVNDVKRVVVRVSDAERYTFAGESPSLSGEYLAYASGPDVHVVQWRTEDPPLVVPRASRPALDWPRLVFRREGQNGRTHLKFWDLETGDRRHVVTVRAGTDIGRASIAGNRIAWHTAAKKGSSIFVHRIGSWTRERFRRSRIALLAYPSLTNWRIAWIELRPTTSYVRVARFRGSRIKTPMSTARRGVRYWTTAFSPGLLFVTRWKTATYRAEIVRKRV